MSEAAEILVVEGDDLLRGLLVTHLKRDGHRVTAAATAEQAKAAATATYFDTVILDLQLRAVDGLEVLEWLRPPQRARSVIVATRIETSRTRQVAQAFGAASVLEKPFAVTELEAAIAQAMGRVEAE